MEEHSNQESLETQYLLGKLSEEEKSRVEERYFADSGSYEELQIAEAELADAYVHGELSVTDRQRYEQRMRSSPALLERTKFAKTLAQSLSSGQLAQPAGSVEQPQISAVSIIKEQKLSWWKVLSVAPFLRRPAFGWALAACAVLVLLGSAVVSVQWISLRNQRRSLAIERDAIERQRQELERQSVELRSGTDQLNTDLQAARQQREIDQKRIEELAQAQKRNEQSRPSIGSTVASIFLFSGSPRGAGGGNELAVSRGIATIKLKLVLESDEYRSYRAIITNSQNVTIQRIGLKPRRSGSVQILSIQILAKLLPPGDYTVGVGGVKSSGAVEPVNDYTFRITAEQK